MSLASLTVFLDRVGYRNGLVTNELIVHSLNRRVGGIKAVITDESETFALSGIWISHYLSCDG